MMDHFNSTIRDGELVNTRRGLQVSRQKFNGISFVNAYPQSSSSPSSSSSKATRSTDQAKVPQRQFKFVDTASVSRQGTPRSQRQDSEASGPGFSDFSSEASQARKPRRRLTPKEASSTYSPAPSPRRSSHASSNASSAGEGSYRSQTPKSQDAPSVDLGGSQKAALSAWPSFEPPANMSEENWSLFHRYFATLPSKIYPYEDILAYNPAMASEFYEMHVKDDAAVQIVMMCGSIATAIVDGEMNPKGLAYYISIICSILNRKLNQNKAVDHVTLLCIAALAASACYVGRLDHWHMHMRGLQKALDVNGGLDGLPVWLLNKIHLTDLEGSTALACGPYLEHIRKFEPVSNILPLPLRNHISSSLSALLGPSQIDPCVIRALSTLSLLTSSIGFARNSSGAVTFEPHAFTDQLLSLRHSLVVQPHPLQNQMADSTPIFNPYEVPGVDTPDKISTNSNGRSELYMGSHRLRPSVPIIPAELGPGGPLEPALRISGLLYLKELLPNWPRNLGGYAILLKLLGEHMQALFNGLAGSRSMNFMQGTFVKSEQGLGEQVFDSQFIDTTPTKLGKQKSGTVKRKTNERSARAPVTANKKSRAKNKEYKAQTEGTPSLAYIKPAVLWLCVIGDMISRIADENEGRRRQRSQDDDLHLHLHHTDYDPYPRTIYQTCLRELIGVQTPQDVDTILANEEDLVMFGLFDPAMIYRRNSLIVKPEHMSLVTIRGLGDDDGGGARPGIGIAPEDWMGEDPPKQRTQQQEGAGVGAEVWELRAALLGILAYDQG